MYHEKCGSSETVVWQTPLNNRNCMFKGRQRRSENVRRRTVSWCDNSHPTSVVTLRFKGPTYPFKATAFQCIGIHLKKIVNKRPEREQEPISKKQVKFMRAGSAPLKCQRVQLLRKTLSLFIYYWHCLCVGVEISITVFGQGWKCHLPRWNLICVKNINLTELCSTLSLHGKLFSHSNITV